MNQNEGRSVSGYLSDQYEGLTAAFSEVEQLSAEGYCALYRAKRYGRWYLLKCLRPEHQDDEAYRQMLRKELEILMRLQHPAVMQVVGMEPVKLPHRGSTMCLVGEWIDGMTLDRFLATTPSPQKLRRIAIDMADAMAYVHQQQVVHREISENTSSLLLLTRLSGTDLPNLILFNLLKLAATCGNLPNAFAYATASATTSSVFFGISTSLSGFRFNSPR